MENMNEIKLMKHQQIIYDLVMNYDYENKSPLKICLNWGRQTGSSTLIQKIFESCKFGTVSRQSNIERHLPSIKNDSKLRLALVSDIKAVVKAEIEYDLLICITQQPVNDIKKMIELYKSYDVVDIKNYKTIETQLLDDSRFDHTSEKFKKECLLLYEDSGVDLKAEYSNLVREYKQCVDEQKINKLHNKIKLLSGLIDLDKKFSGCQF